MYILVWCFSCQVSQCRKSRLGPAEVSAGWTHAAGEELVCRCSCRRRRRWVQFPSRSPSADRMFHITFEVSNQRFISCTLQLPVVFNSLQMTWLLAPFPSSTYPPRSNWVRLTWPCIWRRCREERQSRVTNSPAAGMRNSRIIMSNILIIVPSAADVLQVLTEVDERSRRSPEIIQYFIVSHDQKDKVQSLAVCVTRRSTSGASVCRTTCRDSWRPPRSCVATWPSAWLSAASRTIPGTCADRQHHHTRDLSWGGMCAAKEEKYITQILLICSCFLFTVFLFPVQPCDRLPAHLHVLYGQRRLRRGPDCSEESTRICASLSGWEEITLSYCHSCSGCSL